MYTLATGIAVSTIAAILSFASRSHAAEVVYDAQHRQVTLKVAAVDVMPAMDARGARLLHVFEDGIRQRDVDVDVAHAPVSLAVLIEMGGRSYELTRALQSEAGYVVRPLFDRLGPDDKLAIYTYDSALRPVVDFADSRDTWSAKVDRLEAPRFSEANLYDAVTQVLERMKSIQGRRAIVLLTTGIDTFSRATFDDVVARARQASTPIYWLALGDLARHRVLDVSEGPLARVNWPRLATQCRQLAQVSQGRCYEDVRTLTAPAIFDDVIERLRVHYVLTYLSPRADDRGTRIVDVRLSKRPVRSPARIRQGAGDPEPHTERTVAQVRYTPDGTPGGAS